MRSNVRLSKYAYFLTFIINAVLIICCLSMINEPGFWIVLGIFILLIFFGLLYGPAQIIADSDYVIVKSCLLKHKISTGDIESIELFQPSMGAIRLFASGGYFGYWGLFRDVSLGRYAGYYGKASECFLIKMKNGNKYILGCENPEQMVDYIQSLIK